MWTLASALVIVLAVSCALQGNEKNRQTVFQLLGGTHEMARTKGITRSMAAVDCWKPDLAGSVVVIGNAPTALFRLLELLEEGANPPELILGFPVGFVGAAESKQALLEEATRKDIPFITLLGRRGGSAIASAALNSIAMGTT